MLAATLTFKDFGFVSQNHTLLVCVLASLHTHSESVESPPFHPSHPLPASGGVDVKIVIYEFARGCTVRRTLEGHEEALIFVLEPRSEFGEDIWEGMYADTSAIYSE
ncbi:60S ribosomal subunit assembly or modification protein [Rhizina undulata]